MQSIKPGRGPSAMGAVGSIFAVIFGIFWTIIAARITKDAPGPIATFFPLFGVFFVIMGIVQVIYNFRNATSKERYSAFDITSDQEEPDPLNKIFGQTGAASVENRLREIEELHSNGLISAAEYQAKRAEILKSI